LVGCEVRSLQLAARPRTGPPRNDRPSLEWQGSGIDRIEHEVIRSNDHHPGLASIEVIGSSGDEARRDDIELLTEVDEEPQLGSNADVHDPVGLWVDLADGNLPADSRSSRPCRGKSSCVLRA
jgi:hypothetical protein